MSKAALAIVVAVLALTLSATSSIPASGHSGAVLSAFGSATVDGVISPGEYDSCVSGTRQGPYQTYFFTLCTTNDEANNYYALDINDNSLSQFDGPAFYFDDEHDGVMISCEGGNPRDIPGEDLLYVSESGGLGDSHSCTQGGIIYSASDGTANGAGAKSTGGLGRVFELSHPLDSGDPFDYALSPGDIVGVCVTYFDWYSSPFALWPMNDCVYLGVFGLVPNWSLYGGSYAMSDIGVLSSNTPPTANAGPNQVGDEGSAMSFSLSCSDPDAGQTWTAEVDWGDGNPPQSLGSVTCNGVSFAAPHTYADNGAYTVALTVTDSILTSGSDTAAVTINNVAPAANAGGPYSGDEGNLVPLGGSASDPGAADTLSFSWDLNGDSVFETLAQNPTFSAVDGPDVVTVTLRVCDDDGACDESSATVTVNNVAPSVTSVTNDGPILEGSSATISMTATDPAGPNDPLSFEGDCDGNGSFEVEPQPSNSFSCLFANDGAYTVNVRVTDGDGGSATDSTVVIVISLAQATQNLIETVNGMNIPQDLKDNLSGPLDQAVKLLSDNKPNNDKGVCGKLTAFINQVNDLLADGQLTAEQATELLAQANAIKQSLGC